MASSRSKYLHNDGAMWLFEEQWQVDWLRMTALLLGFKERGDTYVSTLHVLVNDYDVEILVYQQDLKPNAYTDKDALALLIQDPTKRAHFIGGRKDDFFAE